MIIKVKVDEHIYQVEINDLQQRPIIAVVDGEEFEIWPEGEPSKAKQMPAAQRPVPYSPSNVGATTATQATFSPPTPESVNVLGVSQPPQSDTLKVVRAPIPGVITAVNVNPGSEVSVGQQLCVLEAMKMNNSIRASRAGHIGVVHIVTGQHVRHHDILIEYAD
jgi:biotin carboxyl carrier protein